MLHSPITPDPAAQSARDSVDDTARDVTHERFRAAFAWLRPVERLLTPLAIAGGIFFGGLVAAQLICHAAGIPWIGR